MTPYHEEEYEACQEAYALFVFQCKTDFMYWGDTEECQTLVQSGWKRYPWRRSENLAKLWGLEEIDYSKYYLGYFAKGIDGDYYLIVDKKLGLFLLVVLYYLGKHSFAAFKAIKFSKEREPSLKEMVQGSSSDDIKKLDGEPKDVNSKV